MKFTRGETLILAAAASALSVTGIGAAQAADGEMFDQAKLLAPNGLPDKVLGPADAKVTVIEYASPTCPHCAVFSNDTLPEFMKQYVDTGKVRYILRPFVRNVLDAVVFLLAEAAGEDQYHNVVSTYFKTQDTWGVSDKPLDAVKAVALQLGFSDDSFQAALKNQDFFNAIETMRDQALNDFGLEGTPTFYVNGKQLTGEKTMDQLDAEITPLL